MSPSSLGEVEDVSRLRDLLSAIDLVSGVLACAALVTAAFIDSDAIESGALLLWGEMEPHPPCALCGATRSFGALGSFAFQEAWSYNSAAVVLYFLCFLWALRFVTKTIFRS